MRKGIFSESVGPGSWNLISGSEWWPDYRLLIAPKLSRSRQPISQHQTQNPSTHFSPPHQSCIIYVIHDVFLWWPEIQRQIDLDEMSIKFKLNTSWSPPSPPFKEQYEDNICKKKVIGKARIVAKIIRSGNDSSHFLVKSQVLQYLDHLWPELMGLWFSNAEAFFCNV